MKVEEVKSSDLDDFKKQLETKQGGDAQAAANKKISVRKNVILAFVADSAGCGHIRCVFPFTYVNSIFGKNGSMYATISPFFINQPDVLMQTRAIFFQRQMAPGQVAGVQAFKAHQPIFKYKMIYDIDDYIWGYNEEQPGGNKEDGVPSYNFGYPKIDASVKDSCTEIMKMMDMITVSSEFLKYYIENVLKITVPVHVVKNSVSRHFWGDVKRRPIDKKLEKPRVLYTGSPCHYSNEKKMKGDWDNAFCDYVIKAVRDNKIDFTVMGGLPWFFEPIKDKITTVDWVNSYSYANAVKATKPDFLLMPLVPNNFNKSKSNIKFIEACAAGALAIGSTFGPGNYSPYDDIVIPPLAQNCTVADIEKIVNDYSQPHKFNKALKEQYEYLDKNGHWLESPQFVSNFIKYF